MDQEISRYAERLRLSTGELLALAREVAGCARLRSVDDLTMWQRDDLIHLLEVLAMRETRQLVAA